VIDNDSATHGWVGGVDTQFTVNGWTASTVDGRDHGQIAHALGAYRPGQPHLVLARTERKG
jgi:transketolase